MFYGIFLTISFAPCQESVTIFVSIIRLTWIQNAWSWNFSPLCDETRAFGNVRLSHSRAVSKRCKL